MTKTDDPPLARLRPAAQWGLLLPLSLALIWAFRLIGIPSALLLGPVVVAAIMGLSGATVRIPRRFYEFAQGIAGCLIAHYLTPEIFHNMLRIWPAVLFFILLTLALACLVGWAVGKLTDIDGEVAIWGFLPGMAGTIIAMSFDRGLDSRMVAFIQILRLVSVILIMSMVAWALVGGLPAVVPRGAAGATLPGVLLTLAIAVTGPLAARFAAFIPASATLVPLGIAGALQGSGLAQVALPGWLLLATFLVLGTQVGLRFTPDLMRHGLRALPAVLAGVLALMVLCGISGIALSAVVGVDILSAMLATVPGSIDAIAILAIKSDADVAFVMTLQVVRLFAVVLAGPFLAHWLCRVAFPATEP